MKRIISLFSLFILLFVNTVTPVSYAIDEEITLESVSESENTSIGDNSSDIEDDTNQSVESSDSDDIDVIEESQTWDNSDIVDSDEDVNEWDSNEEVAVEENSIENTSNTSEKETDSKWNNEEEKLSCEIPENAQIIENSEEKCEWICSDGFLKSEDWITCNEINFSKYKNEPSVAALCQRLWLDWEVEKWDLAKLVWIEDYLWTREQNETIRLYLVDHVEEILKWEFNKQVELEEKVKWFEYTVETLLNSQEIKWESTYKDITVNVIAPIWSFSEGTTLSITPITKQKELKEIEDQIITQQEDINETLELLAFDISFFYDEKEVQPVEGKTVQVSFDYSDNNKLSATDTNDEQELKVYHLDDKDDNGNIVEEVEVKEVSINEEDSEEWKLVVDADGFSVYAIIKVNTEETLITITYDANGGRFIGGDTQKAVVYSWTKNTEFKVVNFIKAPYRDSDNMSSQSWWMFVGWYKEAECNNKWLWRTSDTTWDMTVYAKWLPFNDKEIEGVSGKLIMMDRNLWSESPSDFGYYFQWGNNYWYKNSNERDTSTSKVNVSNYWPGEYSSSTIFRATVSSMVGWANGDSQKIQNLWWWNGSEEERQGPCPKWYHIPSYDEANNKIWESVFSSLTVGGYLHQGWSAWGNSASLTRYMLSSAYSNTIQQNFYNGKFYPSSYSNAYWWAVRCFKNTTTSTNHTLSFNLNWWTGNIQSQEINDGLTWERPTDPTRTGYTFSWWYLNDVLYDFSQPVNTDTELTAKWTAKKYIITWMNGDELIYTWLYEYDTTPTYTWTNPSKTGTTQTGYTFTWWIPEISTVTWNATYTAKFEETLKKYHIIWQYESWDIISSWDVDYGQIPNYTWTEPTSWSDIKYTYSFTWWTPEPSEVTWNATYTAKFDKKLRPYKITWLDDEDNVVDSWDIEYGQIPSHAAISKNATDEFSYTFSWWTPEPVTVTWEAKYKAVFKSTKNKYTITWKNDNWIVLNTWDVEYWETPIYSWETPSKTWDMQYSYVFTWWTPEIKAVTWAQEYTAVFEKTTRQYTVTFDSNGWSSVTWQNINYNSWVTIPEPPTKTGYTFSWWTLNGELFDFTWTTITWEIVLTGEWKLIQYNINYELNGWVENTWNVLTYTVEDEVTLYNPVKSWYVFDGWFTGVNLTWVTSVTKIEKWSVGDKTFYAQWKSVSEALDEAKQWEKEAVVSSDVIISVEAVTWSSEYTGYTPETWSWFETALYTTIGSGETEDYSLVGVERTVTQTENPQTDFQVKPEELITKAWYAANIAWWLEIFVKKVTKNASGVVTDIERTNHSVNFSKPVAIPIHIKKPVANVEIRVNHGNGYGLIWLSTNPNTTCNSGAASIAYTGWLIPVESWYAWIYTCSASVFVAYTEAPKNGAAWWGIGGWSWGWSWRWSSSSSSNITTDWNTSTIDLKWIVSTPNTDCLNVTEEAKIKYSTETVDAYAWAYANGITTISDIDEAWIYNYVTRAELAKIMVQYLAGVLKKKPTIEEKANFSDVDETLWDLTGYINLAYQYQIMWINADGTPLKEFNPNGLVTRWEFASILSRVVFGVEETTSFTKQINVLNQAGILSNTNPLVLERIERVLLMLHRASNDVPNAKKASDVKFCPIDEEKAAYEWALKYGITSIDDPYAARLSDGLTRAEFAKMMVQYMINVLHKKPILNEDVDYIDVDWGLWDLEWYIKLAYQYQIMWIHWNWEPLTEFEPNRILTRKEFATVFSRILFWDKYNIDGKEYWTKHIAALKEISVLTNGDPALLEIRWWVMLMMYRSADDAKNLNI